MFRTLHHYPPAADYPPAAVLAEGHRRSVYGKMTMYLTRELDPEFQALNDRCRGLVAAFLPPAEDRWTVPAHTPLFGPAEDTGKLYVIREGVLGYTRAGQTLFFYEAGDLVGVEHLFWRWESRIGGEFGVVVDQYDFRALLDGIARSPARLAAWSEYLALQSTLLTSALGALMVTSGPILPEAKTYAAGETIILEGDAAEEVFTLIEGHADVYVDQVKVGEVLRDEMFGILAALGETRRTASVVASTDSLVVKLPKSQFVELVQSRPFTVSRMVEDMARTIMSLNDWVVQHAGDGAPLPELPLGSDHDEL